MSLLDWDAYCGYCGSEMAGMTTDEAFFDDNGTCYCCQDCLHNASNERWEVENYSPIQIDCDYLD